jgi:hypothetical protein
LPVPRITAIVVRVRTSCAVSAPISPGHYFPASSSSGAAVVDRRATAAREVASWNSLRSSARRERTRHPSSTRESNGGTNPRSAHQAREGRKGPP